MSRRGVSLKCLIFALGGVGHTFASTHVEPKKQQASIVNTGSQAPQATLDEAIAVYYMDVKVYALRYVHTPAAPGDIADAALSASSSYKELTRILAQKIGWQNAPAAAKEFRGNARRFAIQLILEARYPNPDGTEERPKTNPTKPSKEKQ